MRRVWFVAALMLVYWLLAASQTGREAKGEGRAKGKPITLLIVPKIKGIDYFNACEKGAREAAKELGSVRLIYEGPTEASVERQVELIEAWIARKPDVIAVACNDPSAIAPALKKAMSRGIRVITWDADAKRDAREFLSTKRPTMTSRRRWWTRWQSRQAKMHPLPSSPVHSQLQTKANGSSG